MDARGIPTCLCPSCGSDLFRALVRFDPETYTIGMYHLDMQCQGCDALCTAPTPLDNPNIDLNNKNIKEDLDE